MSYKISEDLIDRIPLMKSEWMSMILKMRESNYAPKWNTLCGDRLTQEDHLQIKQFEDKLKENRKNYGKSIPPFIIQWISQLKPHSLWFQKRLNHTSWENDFSLIPTMERKDLQDHLEIIVPLNQELSRIIVNPTSGTTGQPILAPNHPAAIGCYDPMIQFALNKNGINIEYNHNIMAAIQICAQKKTITYNTVHSYLNGAGFAKINLNPEDWKDVKNANLFIEEMAPIFFSGDPFAFYQAMQWGINYKPKALLSSAMIMEPEFRNQLTDFYSCPVVNFYSLNETGPIGYSCKHHPDQFHILPHDIYVETIDFNGTPVNEGLKGEIVVTGGRNPFIPLLRYRTGDYGILDNSPCSCGDPMPRIKGFEGRKMVIFKNRHCKMINPVDISRILKDYPLFLHQFIQKKDLNGSLRLLPSQILTETMIWEIKTKLKDLFGQNHDFEILFDLDPALSKIIPFIAE